MEERNSEKWPALPRLLYTRINDSLVGRFRKIFQNAENSAAFPH